MAKKGLRAVDGWKSKVWYKVVTPMMFGKSEIGEIVSDDPSKLLDRIMEMTLGDLTNDFSKQNTVLYFKINEVAGDVASTKFIGHKTTRDYVRSLIKRKTSMIDAMVNVMTKDGYSLRIKGLCFTVKRARASQIRAIRDIMVKMLSRRAPELEFSQCIQEIVLGKMASDLYMATKKVYPIRRIEIIRTEIREEPEFVIESTEEAVSA